MWRFGPCAAIGNTRDVDGMKSRPAWFRITQKFWTWNVIVSRHMGLSLVTRRDRDHTIIEASGRLVAGEPCSQLRDLIKRLASEGERAFVLNMAGVSHMDSSGLGLLLSVYSTIRAQGGDVKLVSMGERVKELFQMTKLTEVFSIFEDENRALAAEAVNEPLARRARPSPS